MRGYVRIVMLAAAFGGANASAQTTKIDLTTADGVARSEGGLAMA